jgi:hypothetical protein
VLLSGCLATLDASIAETSFAHHEIQTTGPIAPKIAAASESATATRTRTRVLTRERQRRPEFILGSTHVHAYNSGDSRVKTRKVVRWYERHGYGFIVLTDHNHVSVYERPTSLVVIPGAELTHNIYRCVNPRGRGGCRVHVNTLFADPVTGGKVRWRPWGIRDRSIIYERAIQTAENLGGLAQINHPNWGFGMTPALLTDLASRRPVFMEIANAQFRRWDRGNERYPSTEKLWDRALTAGANVLAVASDDAHQYRHPRRRLGPGGAFIGVRARRSATAIRAAMLNGDFYASTGVRLRRADLIDDVLEIEVASSSRGPHRIELIGTGGEVLETVRGTRARFPVPAGHSYVRARVLRRDRKMAWTQAFRP